MRYLMLLVIFLIMVWPVQAQEGARLTDEELALLDQFVQMFTNVMNYERFVMDCEQEFEANSHFVLEEEVLEVAQRSDTTFQIMLVERDENGSLVFEQTFNFIQVLGDETEETQASQSGEVRLVDGGYYVQVESSDELPFGEGWVTIDDTNRDEVFAFVGLTDGQFFQDVFESPLGDVSLLADAEWLAVAVLGVTGEDGKDATAVTVTLDVPYQEEVGGILSPVGTNLISTFTLVSNSDGDLISLIFGQESPNEGNLDDDQFEDIALTLDCRFSQIDEALEPIAIP